MKDQTERGEVGRAAVSKWIIRKAKLKDNLCFINATKLYYCSQSHCPHSGLEPGGGGGER